MRSEPEGTFCIPIMASRQKVAFIGDYVAEELYGSAENAVGETIKINGDAYTVIGVAERQTEDTADFDDGCTDDFVWIPYSRAVKLSGTPISQAISLLPGIRTVRTPVQRLWNPFYMTIC